MITFVVVGGGAGSERPGMETMIFQKVLKMMMIFSQSVGLWSRGWRRGGVDGDGVDVCNFPSGKMVKYTIWSSNFVTILVHRLSCF
ncbi:hypothetical protein LINGRAHAP2_LOCUS12914 [Linum grandiflorum]